jgi:hypothetical protein
VDYDDIRSRVIGAVGEAGALELLGVEQARVLGLLVSSIGKAFPKRVPGGTA